MQGLRRELDASSALDIGRLIHEHVCAGGTIDEVVETRPEWSEHSFHYDLRIQVEGRPVYIETRLFFDAPDDPDDPWIHIVSFHAP